MMTQTEKSSLAGYSGEVQVIQTGSDKGIAVLYNPSLRCVHKFVPVHLKFSWDNQLEKIWEMSTPISSLLVEVARIGPVQPDKAVITAKLDEELAVLQKKIEELKIAKEQVSNS